MLRPPPQFVPANYGYWITSSGEVLKVDQREGHVSLLMDHGAFGDLSPTQPYHGWYESALSRGWVRVVAPAKNRRQFRFQFAYLDQATRLSLIRLIRELNPYDCYVYESSQYLAFDSLRDVVQFVTNFRGTALSLGEDGWTAPNDKPSGNTNV